MRNFLYNKSDLFVALVIIVIAVFIIYMRVDAIMGGAAGKELNGTENRPLPIEPASPGAAETTAAAEGHSDTDGIEPDAAVTPDGVDSAEANPPADPATSDTPAEPADASDNEPVLFTIEIGTTTGTVAKNLAAAGLVKSSKSFLKEVKKQNAEMKMKAGTFKIKPGTSVSKIVKILSN
jgi:hypothetical protein